MNQSQLHPDVLAWAEELGAEATTVTELLEEDNEEVGLGLVVLDVVIVILHVCILHTLRRSSLKSWPRSKRSTGKQFPTLRR